MARALLRLPLVLLLMIAAGSAVAQAKAPPADTMAQRMQACTACHGEQGRATSHGYFPRIAGKPAGYLYNQLVNFQQGRRNNASMTYLVEHLTDAYLREIAQYFAALDLPYPPPPVHADATPAALALGERLVRQGDPQRQLPACAGCHGERMTGVQPAMPGLLGLPRDYLLAQLGAWRTGQRRAVAPDCMGEIARRMAPEEVSAVALWLSTQPVADPKPAARLPVAPTVECGSGFK